MRSTVIARRGEQHDSGLGVYRWSLSRVSPYCTGSARIRWEIRDDIHEAFLRFACAIICWRRLHNISNC
jgi:hypothetical protein